MPATTGGSTNGKITTARSSDRPRNLVRARIHPSGAPRITEQSAARRETTSESRSAVSAASPVRVDSPVGV